MGGQITYPESYKPGTQSTSSMATPAMAFHPLSFHFPSHTPSYLDLFFFWGLVNTKSTVLLWVHGFGLHSMDGMHETYYGRFGITVCMEPVSHFLWRFTHHCLFFIICLCFIWLCLLS